MAVHQFPRALSLAVGVALVVGLSACGDDARPTGTTAADRSFIGSADSAACNSDERTIEVAIEAFETLNDRLPSSIDELVSAGILREVSTNFEVDPKGAVVPLDTGRCN